MKTIRLMHGKWFGTAGMSLVMAIALVMAGGAGVAQAKVTGLCSNCHTMHNSQSGTSVVHAGAGAAWNAGGTELSGGDAFTVQKTLLSTDCVGCHSSGGAATIVNIGDSRVPIVYNTSGAPAQPLAGGNFYWVVNSGDAYGHNVRGISAKDQALAWAPGVGMGCSPCHESLALPNNGGKVGCEMCHESVRHHGNDPAGEPVGAAGGWYRFLSSPPGHFGVGGGGVTGIEDPDWEQSPTTANHNIYSGGSGHDNDNPQSIGKYCAGCHALFHSPGFAQDFTGENNGGGGGPWLRHPTDVAIPADRGEYIAVIGSDYDPQVPVGKPNLGAYNAAVIEDGDQVICISCHRAHGSPNKDMLRWEYGGMLAHDPAAAVGTGCFKCHTTKDDV